MAEKAAATKPVIPYLPFKTFLNTLDGLASFWPDVIDKSLWQNLAGGTQSQLVAAYKFLGLIDNGGIPSAELKKLADDKANRPALLREILKRSYGDLLKLDLSKATPASFDAELRKLGQEGDTHRKAATFFLAAAKYANVPLSPLLTKRGSMTVMRPRRTRGRRNGGNVQQPAPQRAAGTGQQSGAQRSFQLPGGTVVTLGTSTDAFHMGAEDRKIVFKLLEQLEAYPTDSEADTEEEEDAQDE